MVLLLTTCEERERSNPFDPNADPDAWAPSNLQAEVINDSQIKLTWTQEAEQISGSRIERKADSGSFSQIAEVDADVTEYTDTDLTLGSAYTYRVKAFTDASESDYAETTVNFWKDCNDDWDGTAFEGVCGCVGGNTGLEADFCYWFTGFESGNLDEFHVEGGNISISSNAYEGNYSVFMEHYAGQTHHNFYPEELMVHYGDFSVVGATSGSISDLDIWLFQGDEAEGENLKFSLRPNGSDTPGINIVGFGVEESTSPSFNIGQWITIDMHVEPGYVSLSVNGELLLESYDLEPVPQGRFKLGVIFQGYYDNMSYTQFETD